MAKSNNAPFLQAVQWIVSVLMFFAMIIAIAAVYQSISVEAGARFAKTPTMLSVIAFAITAHLWVRSLKCCLGMCEK